MDDAANANYGPGRRIDRRRFLRYAGTAGALSAAAGR